MSTFGDSIREQRVGQGMGQNPLPPLVVQTYEDFSAGLIRSLSPSSIPPNSASYEVDMEVANDGGLKVAPGIVQVEDATPHVLDWIFEHISIDPESRLVAIAPPYVGVKGAGAFAWTNHAISALDARWTAVNALGDLIFSNGRAAYRRTFAGAVTDITTEITARALGSAFGRLFAGAYWANGQEQSLGIKWNTASNVNATTNWTTDGAGGEFLLGDSQLPDRIVGIRSLGFDVMGILNRRSLWAGYPTGVANRPADFRIRFSGIGCVSERTIAPTPWGLAFLSDDGVALYDVNQVTVISQAINPDLLPLNEADLDAYTGAYDPKNQRYTLSAPGGAWVYEFAQPGRPARWFFRSAVADGVHMFGLVAGVNPVPPAIYFTKGTLLGRESAISTAFGVALTPRWRTPDMARDAFNGQFTTTAVRIEYKSLAAIQTAEIWLADHTETYVLAATISLPATGGATKREFVDFVHTGRTVSIEVRPAAASTDLRIKRVQQVIRPAGILGNA